MIPGIPLALAFTCMLAAVPGALISAPFSLVLLAAFMTQLGALETAPVLIAVITAFLAMESVKYVIPTRRRTSPLNESGDRLTAVIWTGTRTESGCPGSSAMA